MSNFKKFQEGLQIIQIALYYVTITSHFKFNLNNDFKFFIGILF